MERGPFVPVLFGAGVLQQIDRRFGNRRAAGDPVLVVVLIAVGRVGGPKPLGTVPRGADHAGGLTHVVELVGVHDVVPVADDVVLARGIKLGLVAAVFHPQLLS